MTRTTIPTPGRNKLTERLLAQGVKLEDHTTWPEGVWACEINNFGYSREYRFTPTWESPCGLLIHEHGDMWGETWVDGEFKCAENDNPLFRCPTPGKLCPHRLNLPAGINCQFHRTDREWNEADSVERIQKERDEALRILWEQDFKRLPGWTGVCANLTTEDLQDGSVRYRARYNVEACINGRCQSTQCVCRNGAERDISPANIFYDIYVERRYTEGMLPYTDKRLTKGLRVFDRPITRTDADIALKLWLNDPDSPAVPSIMRRKLDVVESADSRERFFVRHHRYWDGHTDIEMFIEIRNIRVGKNEQRDMLQDLQDVQNGIAVEHASDSQKAAKAAKTLARQSRQIKKYGRALADGKLRNINKLRPEILQAAKDEADRIRNKRRSKAQMEDDKAGQISIFDLEE